MRKYRSLVLPLAIVLGLLFHKWCFLFRDVVPYIVFVILLLNFTATDVRKLKFSTLDALLILFQIAVGVGGYVLLRFLHCDEVIAQGILIGVLCPVAASVVVVACMLGADRQTVTSYTIWGNLMVAIVAPICFSFVGVRQNMPFFDSFSLILMKISPIIALPFFMALLLQFFAKRLNDAIARYKSASFYLWATALFLTLGQTFDSLFCNGSAIAYYLVWLGFCSLVCCAVQFAFGKWLGEKFGDRIAGGQLLGQKNSAVGIWMANTYLHPVSAVFIAFYSVWQNLFNSFQIWRKNRNERTK